MSSYCTNCGTQLPDGAAFCPHCGTARRVVKVETTPQPVPTPAAPQTPVTPVAPQSVAPAAQQPPLNWRKLLIPAIALVAVIAIVLVVMSKSGSGKGSSYESAIDNYFSVQLGDISVSKVKALAPAEYWEYMEDKYGETFDEYYEDIADELDEYKENLEDKYGRNIKITYEITKERDVSEKNLGYIAEYLADQYDINEDDVTAGYRLDMEMTIMGSDDSDDDEVEDVYVLKIGGKWYLAMVELDKENTTVYFYV